MGEALASCIDDLLQASADRIGSGSGGTECTVRLGNRKYVIGGNDAESALSIGIKIMDESKEQWEDPMILGTKPTTSSAYWAMPLDDSRILVVKNGSTTDDRIWFLEVDTQFVKEQSKLSGTSVVAWSNGVCGYVGKPIVISGPSGVGKGTLISKLMKQFPSMFGFSVSHTTRAPRIKEVDGIHYHFTDRSVMETDIREGRFLEFASVHGNLYGTSIEAVEAVADEGKRCILDIDVQGARSVRASPMEAIFIFVCPPSYDDLEKRLHARGTETEEQIQKRLKNAKEEIEQGKSPGLFDHVLVNDDLYACFGRLKKLLDLNKQVDNAHQPDLQLPLLDSVSKVDGKIYLNYTSTEDANDELRKILLDVAFLKGGAPGRTRGLKLSIVPAS